MRALLAVALSLVLAGHVQGATNQAAAVKIALIGDSTVTDGAGWGKTFADRFTDGVKVFNFAAGGRSSKSWHHEKRLPAALAVKPDYVLIQFGHNDQPGKGPDRETDPATTYRDFLRLYVTAFREAGAQPVIVSSVTRRTFGKDNKIASTLTPYAEAAKALAAEMKAPFIDLHTLSVEHHNRIGPEASMAYNPKKDDITHFNTKGAQAIAELILQQLQIAAPNLSAYIKKPTE